MRRCLLLLRGLLNIALFCLIGAILFAACGDPAELTTTSSSTTSPPASTTTQPPPTTTTPSTTTTVVDDYADEVEGAAGMVLGESVEGGIDFEGDVDYFVFEAVGGEVYEVDVALGTLSDSEVAVYSADGWELGFNNDRGDGSLASRLFWTAPLTGDFYVGVWGYDEGSYSLTVGVSDVVDDFADGRLRAARLVVGESVEGVLDYVGDVDYFFFEVVEGELYEIEVTLGTLSDSFVTVYDADGYLWDSNDDKEGSLGSRLVWGAPVSGAFYVEVSGYGEGSYTLNVGVSE